MPPDARNRITLAMNCLLIHAGGKRILVETGAGDKWNRKLRDIYGIERSQSCGWSARLRPAAGGYRHRGEHASALRPLRRQYVRQKKEKCYPLFPTPATWCSAENSTTRKIPTSATAPAILTKTIVPLESAGMLSLVEGDHAIVPGVELIVVPGHTRAHAVRETHWRRQDRLLFRGLDSHHRASAASVDYGLRSLPHDDA